MFFFYSYCGLTLSQFKIKQFIYSVIILSENMKPFVWLCFNYIHTFSSWSVVNVFNIVKVHSYILKSPLTVKDLGQM